MKVKKLGAAVLAGCTLTVLTVTTPAFAAVPHIGTCDSGDMCIFDGTTFTGASGGMYFSISNMAGEYYSNQTTKLNDTGSSIKNRQALLGASYYVDAYFRGDSIDLLAGETFAYLPYQTNNKISSVYS